MYPLLEQQAADNLSELRNYSVQTMKGILAASGVPRSPEIYVERHSLVGELREALVKVARCEEGGWVVLHGKYWINCTSWMNIVFEVCPA